MTSRFYQIFEQRHVVLPVIHVESESQAVRNALLAKDTDCDGVFLINHQFGHAELLDIYATVTAELPGFWIGINSLGRQTDNPFTEDIEGVAGLWVDNAGIDEDMGRSQPYAQHLLDARNSADWMGLYFGGVAFKYQRKVTELEAAARIASDYVDVVTTSGPGTGSAAAVDKIHRMKQAIPDFPLAIASGITPENVHQYLPCADCFLVATGISKSFTELEPDRVTALVEIVRQGV